MGFRNPLARLSAAHLTSGALPPGVVITAGTPDGARVEITAAGLRAYADDGTTVLADLTGGEAVFCGQVLGAIITGGTLRTAAAGPRVEVDHAGGQGEVRLYNDFDGPARLRAWRADGVNAFPYLELRGGVGSAGEAALVLYQDYAAVSGVERIARLDADRLDVPGSLAVGGKITGNPWAFYVPILSGITLGNGTLTARWNRTGRTIRASGQITLGTSSIVTGNVVVSLPVAVAGTYNSIFASLGTGLANDTGMSTEIVFPTIASATTFYLRRASGAALGPGVPFVWNNGDVMTWNVAYEAAS